MERRAENGMLGLELWCEDQDCVGEDERVSSFLMMREGVGVRMAISSRAETSFLLSWR